MTRKFIIFNHNGIIVCYEKNSATYFRVDIFNFLRV